MRLNVDFKKACIAGMFFTSVGFLLSSDTDLKVEAGFISSPTKIDVSLTNAKSPAPVKKKADIKEAPKVDVSSVRGAFIQLDNLADRVARYKEFCNESPADCDFPLAGKKAVHMDDNLKKLLDTVNTTVNSAITYEEDIVVYGVESKWAIPKYEEGKGLRGDCEDYALQKRKILMDYIPPESMMLAIVAFDDTQTHAILVVRTTQGDYVLDNAKKDVKLARDTGYRFMFASNPENDRVWSGASIFSDDKKDAELSDFYKINSVVLDKHIPDETTIYLAMGLVGPEEKTVQMASANTSLVPAAQ